MFYKFVNITRTYYESPVLFIGAECSRQRVEIESCIYEQCISKNIYRSPLIRTQNVLVENEGEVSIIDSSK